MRSTNLLLLLLLLLLQTVSHICANVMAWGDLHSLPMCYHAKFGRSALKGTCIDTGQPQIGER